MTCMCGHMDYGEPLIQGVPFSVRLAVTDEEGHPATLDTGERLVIALYGSLGRIAYGDTAAGTIVYDVASGKYVYNVDSETSARCVGEIKVEATLADGTGAIGSSSIMNKYVEPRQNNDLV